MNNSAKIALVTGGSRGLGRATVEALAQRGVNVVLTYKTRLAEANEVVTRVEALGARAIALPFSAGEIDTFDAFVSAFQGALTELGADKFDYLVNNAGNASGMGFLNASGMGFLNATEAEFDALYRIHVKSVFFLSQKLLPLLADGGRIVNVSSGLTRIVMANRAPYAIMKSAVETLTRYMAFELGSRGITVNCVAPGAIATDFSGGVVRDNPQVAQAVANMTALGRPGLPEDIGPMIASLLSDDHRWVNAQRIEVSGGMRI
ncbi:TPA: SDR family NAD(P)-dependent oxidoreductase [Klebsiella pneumoniae]